MYVVTLSVFHNLAIWLLYVNKPEPKIRPYLLYGMRTGNRIPKLSIGTNFNDLERLLALDFKVTPLFDV